MIDLLGEIKKKMKEWKVQHVKISFNEDQTGVFLRPLVDHNPRVRTYMIPKEYFHPKTIKAEPLGKTGIKISVVTEGDKREK